MPLYPPASGGTPTSITQAGGAVSVDAAGMIVLAPLAGQGIGVGAADVLLWRDAADVLAQRRTTNPQTFRLYNTWTDASNYERLNIGWASNVLTLGTAKGGTGTLRAMVLNAERITFQSSGFDRWLVADNGNLYASTDNSYDIGFIGGTNRPKDILLAGNLRLGTLADGGGLKVVCLGNATTVPSTNPAAGGVLYAEGGNLRWRSSAGTVTTIAPV